jgi:hypothetical protein
MKHPTAMELPRGDRRGESPLDERLDEVRALLAMDVAGEGAVLALDETPECRSTCNRNRA